MQHDENNQENAEWEAFRHAEQHDQSDLDILKSRMLKDVMNMSELIRIQI